MTIPELIITEIKNYLEENSPFQIFITVWALLIIIRNFLPIKKNKKTENEIEKIYKAMALVAQHPYEKINIMSPKHLEHYNKLKEYADKNNLIVCPKVHMRHLLLPERDSYEATKLNNLISNKFVDFVLCTQNMNVVKIIMIKNDDSENEKALTDLYTKMFTDAGHEIVFTKEITNDILRFE